ncbi:MAG: hypothetical protein FJ026_03955 [Chloroflexi bacterium]|nr:hypothetical protein [Chloroflexota bacterium]
MAVGVCVGVWVWVGVIVGVCVGVCVGVGVAVGLAVGVAEAVGVAQGLRRVQRMASKPMYCWPTGSPVLSPRLTRLADPPSKVKAPRTIHWL